MNPILPHSGRTRRQPFRSFGFTLVEVLVAMAVLVSILLLMISVINQTALVTASSRSRGSADSDARQVMDRFGSDLASAPLRKDLPLAIGKNTGTASASQNDSIGLFTQMEGYEGDRGISRVSHGIIDGKLHREASGTFWASGDGTVLSFDTAPSGAPGANSDELARDVFRFELAFLMKDGTLKASVATLEGETDAEKVAAIIVGIAVLDAHTRERMHGSIDGLSSMFRDTQDGKDLLTLWSEDLNALGLHQGDSDYPKNVLAAIRIYQRFFYLER